MSTTTSAATSAVTYNIDPAHSAAHFKVRHLMIANVRGEFGKVSGTITFDREHPENSSVVAEIEVESINTREPQRDAHLKSPDFFDAANHPSMIFKSTKVEPAGHHRFTVTGDLTIRGTSKQVVLDVHGPTHEAKDPWGLLRAGAEAETTINRKEFGLVWNQVLETGGVAVGEDVHISLEIEMVRPAA